MSDITTDELEKLIEELELLAGVHFYDHETLGEAKKLISQYLKQATLKARIDELGSVQLEYNHLLAQTFRDGQAMTVQKRYDYLQAQLTTNKSKE